MFIWPFGPIFAILGLGAPGRPSLSTPMLNGTAVGENGRLSLQADIRPLKCKRTLSRLLVVSCKGVTGAYRNLSNFLEETVGECTDLRITYMPLVLGYLVLLRANRQRENALEAAAEAMEDVTTPEAARRALSTKDVAVGATARRR